MKNIRIILLSAVLLLLTGVMPAVSQQIRTAYFFDNAPIANYINPSLMPERGFVSIPGAGAIGVAYLSNGLKPNHLFYNKGGDVVFFTDNKVSAEEFLKNIGSYNTFNIDVNVGLVNAGWHMGKGFATIGIGARANINAGFPKEMFEFIKNETHGDSYKMKDFRLLGESYTELAFGYTRPITKKLTIGGKVKALVGVANIDMRIDRIISEYDYSADTWKVTSKGRFNASMKGFSADYDNKGYLNDFDIGTPGVSGFGGAIDVGATYKVLDNLRVSASILDLGFITWRKSYTTSGSADISKTVDFDGFKDKEDVEDFISGLEDMFQFDKTGTKSRTTRLRATLNLGAEYSILDNLLGFGILSSTRFYQPKAYTEVTAMVNVRPAEWFTGALSYSFIHSEFKTLGLAFNFHTSFINFFLGSDYVIFNAKKGIPQSAQSASVYFGLSVPLCKSKYRAGN